MLVLNMCWLKVIQRSSGSVTSEYGDVCFIVGLLGREIWVLGERACSTLGEEPPKMGPSGNAVQSAGDSIVHNLSRMPLVQKQPSL